MAVGGQPASGVRENARGDIVMPAPWLLLPQIIQFREAQLPKANWSMKVTEEGMVTTARLELE
jgi:hypothetical protein